ncbi:hypothetical protein DesLBE_1535 [Desulfitobacterium sp. LBE]|uniref:Zinc-ribbon domain n=4 Tax=root TaxID=1 RepID=A0A098B5V6_DESHA|nr:MULTISPECIES: hypothetical protein [Desulfitobacterium]ACL19912.1 conserved hypothetical protein [Desulfitobacterium hafniense DCB-2]EHL08636.1 hypothetical protein HMPREF0322_00729 [Desulfitobacterium hafniense DP7]TWH57267.1 hypothetical protein DesLBE_1535 [Desulfitobacterium sp. LBE]CDX03732.1 zinc-ribbon domain [Desulfitobacterium hafniense]
MCFRPPTANKPVKCPACGMYNPPTMKVCKKCGFDGTEGSGDPSKQKPKNED